MPQGAEGEVERKSIKCEILKIKDQFRKNDIMKAISSVNGELLFLRELAILKCVKLTSSGSNSTLCAKWLYCETSLQSRLTC